MFWILLACSGDKVDSGSVDAEILDYTMEYDHEESDLIFEPPNIIVEPYTDQMMCWFTTYTGNDIGISKGSFWQHEHFGHHLIVMRTNADEDDYPDGMIVDCTDSEALPMTDLEPFVLPSEVAEGSVNRLDLPAGMANKLKQGERLLVQSHHINTTAERVRVNDKIALETIAIEDVDTFVAPLAHTSTSLNIPVGEYSKEVTCVFEDDHHFLYLLGHMHEWGKSITIDYNKEDGTTERLYEIEAWDVLYRDLPPITRYDIDAFQVKAGESFTTTCTWNNDTEGTLSFPEEMCVATAMIYPAVVATICDVD